MAHETVIVRDLNGTIRFWNQGAERMYGWKKEEALGQLKQTLLRPEFPRPFNDIQDELLRTGYWQGELVHVCRDGQRKIMEGRWALQSRGVDSPVVLEINSDVTARKQSENSLRELSGYLMRVQDEERRRLARELHDSTGQRMVALKMNLAALDRPAKPGSDNRKTLADSIKLVDEAIDEIRALSHVLHPPLLDEVGLISATRWLVDGFADRAGIQVNLKAEKTMGRLPQNIEIALFRVIQESLNNVYRHAEATRATVELKRNDREITLRIKDNGKGIAKELLAKSGGAAATVGVGMLGMRERIAQLGGSLQITSSEKGTVVTAVVSTSTSASSEKDAGSKPAKTS